MKKTTIISLGTFIASLGCSYAGQGFNVDIKNTTGRNLTISTIGQDCWYSKDLPSKNYSASNSILIEPESTKHFYTEKKASGGCWGANGHITVHAEKEGYDTKELKDKDALSFKISYGYQAADSDIKDKTGKYIDGINIDPDKQNTFDIEWNGTNFINKTIVK